MFEYYIVILCFFVAHNMNMRALHNPRSPVCCISQCYNVYGSDSRATLKDPTSMGGAGGPGGLPYPPGRFAAAASMTRFFGYYYVAIYTDYQIGFAAQLD